MAGREIAHRTIQQVRPVLSVNKEEARRRVLNLYKAWYRKIPFIGKLIVDNLAWPEVTQSIWHRGMASSCNRR